MSDPKAIFRSLTAGISFDKKRFRSDAEKFGLTNKKFDGANTVEEFVALPELLSDLNDQSNDAATNNEESSSDSEEEELKLLGDDEMRTNLFNFLKRKL
jgi:hypothetical protein